MGSGVVRTPGFRSVQSPQPCQISLFSLHIWAFRPKVRSAPRALGFDSRHFSASTPSRSIRGSICGPWGALGASAKMRSADPKPPPPPPRMAACSRHARVCGGGGGGLLSKKGLNTDKAAIVTVARDSVTVARDSVTVGRRFRHSCQTDPSRLPDDSVTVARQCGTDVRAWRCGLSVFQRTAGQIHTPRWSPGRSAREQPGCPHNPLPVVTSHHLRAEGDFDEVRWVRTASPKPNHRRHPYAPSYGCFLFSCVPRFLRVWRMPGTGKALVLQPLSTFLSPEQRVQFANCRNGTEPPKSTGQSGISKPVSGPSASTCKPPGSWRIQTTPCVLARSLTISGAAVRMRAAKDPVGTVFHSGVVEVVS